jgi:hypothetical protein
LIITAIVPFRKRTTSTFEGSFAVFDPYAIDTYKSWQFLLHSSYIKFIVKVYSG